MHPLLESLFAFLFKYRPLVFRQGEVTFAVPRSTATFIVIAIAVGIVAALTYGWVRTEGARRHRIVLGFTRVCVLALLGFCLMRPSLSVPALIEQRGYVAVLVDHSRSMSQRDENGMSRAQAASNLLAPTSELRQRLEEKFRVRYYGFSDRAATIRPDSVGRLGDATDIGAALEQVTSDLSGLPLAGVVIVSDGADNAQRDWAESLLPLRSAHVPVFTVGVGRESNERDVQLTRVSLPPTVLKGATVLADAELHYRGMGGSTVRVEVEDAGRLLAREEMQLPRSGDVAHVSLSFPAAESGPRRLRVRVTPMQGEKQLQNNERQLLVDVRDRREKILLVDGEPRFEDKFIRRALTNENNLQLVQLLRTAPKKLLRLDVDSANELANGFPMTRAELFKYRALILGSIEASYFTHDQLQLIADFVSVRGGGLLMMGGPKAFAEGGWAGTAVADALPVTLERSTTPAKFTMVHVLPTAAGTLHPIARIDSTAAASAQRWQQLPELSTVNTVGSLKPGATALLTADATHAPILAYQRFGRGQALVFTPQDSWLWQMHHDISVEDQTHETFWRELLRYLVQDVNDAVHVAAPVAAQMQQPMTLTATVADSAFGALTDAQVTARVRQPDGSERSVPLTTSAHGYTASLLPTQAGVHEIAIEAKRGDQVLGDARTFINVSAQDIEMFDPQARPATLARIAHETGGRPYNLATAAAIPEDISLLGHGVAVHEQKDLWDMPVVFLLVVIALCGEWLYRRRKGLV